ncbi:MAG: hypothetical protein COA79_08915 [Planctomycetota bacterium]|nr:MAG: hypothetical protein COA79_08915 [Planctomycetota bacterium]
MIKFICTCGIELNVPDGLAHKVVTCNSCGKKDIELPGPGETLDLNEEDEFVDSDAEATIAIDEPPARSERKSKRESTRGRGRKRRSREEEDDEDDEEDEELPSRPRSRTKRLDKRSAKKEMVEEPEEEESEIPHKKTSNKRNAPKSKRKDADRARSRGRMASKSRIIEKEDEPEEDIEELEEDEKPRRESKRKDLGRDASKSRSGLGRQSRKSGRNSDDEETGSSIRAARGSRGNSRRGSSRKNEDDDYSNAGGGGEKKIIFLIVFLLLAGGGATLYFQFFAKSGKGTASTLTTTTGTSGSSGNNGSQGTPDKIPEVAEFDYPEIESVGRLVVNRFGLEGDKKTKLEESLAERAKSAKKNKMTTTDYNNVKDVLLKKMLMLILAIDQILTKKITNMADANKICYTIMQRVVDDNPKIDILLKGFPEIDLEGSNAIVWDKAKVEIYFKSLTKELMDGGQLVDSFEWSKVIDMILYHTIDTDSNDLENSLTR